MCDLFIFYLELLLYLTNPCRFDCNPLSLGFCPSYLTLVYKDNYNHRHYLKFVSMYPSQKPYDHPKE